MKTSIIVTNQFEGIHRYKDAPSEVAFLRDYHRHIFTIKSKIEVFFEDRELEFIIVKRTINDFLEGKKKDNGYWFMDNMSCEQVASEVFKLLKEKYGAERTVSVEVSEDGENSAIIEEEN